VTRGPSANMTTPFVKYLLYSDLFFGMDVAQDVLPKIRVKPTALVSWRQRIAATMLARQTADLNSPVTRDLTVADRIPPISAQEVESITTT
ncbi:MAG: hypothetical protein WD070_10885, partial [Pirellulaceae bacterium]